MHKILSKGLNKFVAKDECGWVQGVPWGAWGTWLYPMCVSAISSPLDWWGVRLEDYVVVSPAMECFGGQLTGYLITCEEHGVISNELLDIEIATVCRRAIYVEPVHI